MQFTAPVQANWRKCIPRDPRDPRLLLFPWKDNSKASNCSCSCSCSHSIPGGLVSFPTLRCTLSPYQLPGYHLPPAEARSRRIHLLPEGLGFSNSTRKMPTGFLPSGRFKIDYNSTHYKHSVSALNLLPSLLFPSAYCAPVPSQVVVFLGYRGSPSN